MNCSSQENIIELAIALANKEPLSKESQSCREHVQQCTQCKQRLDDFLHTVSRVKASLHGLNEPESTPDCLDNNLLAAYVEHSLDKAGQDHVEQHAATCDYCFWQLLELSELKEQFEANQDRCEFILRWVQSGLEWLSHPEEGFSMLTPNAVPVLSGNAAKDASHEKSCYWNQSFGEYSMQCRCSGDADQHFDLYLCLKRPAALPEGIRVNLRSKGRLLQSEPLDEAGTLIHDLSPNKYDIELIFPREKRISFLLQLT